MADSFDYKKEYKDLYLPKTIPQIIEIPTMKFVQVEGQGNPNIPNGEYQKAVQILYSVSFTIKMSPKSGFVIPDYFSYIVPPLEGLWTLPEKPEENIIDKDKLKWTSMIRQPEFIDEDIFSKVCEIIRRKKPEIDISKAKFVEFTEGLCVQCMHIGSYDDEPATIKRVYEFVEENGYELDFSDERKHHEIYLSDPRKTKVENCKTVLRFPVRRK